MPCYNNKPVVKLTYELGGVRKEEIRSQKADALQRADLLLKANAESFALVNIRNAETDEILVSGFEFHEPAPKPQNSN